jgi:hypothetical protein
MLAMMYWMSLMDEAEGLMPCSRLFHRFQLTIQARDTAKRAFFVEKF